jgi:hypothetical protein
VANDKEAAGQRQRIMDRMLFRSYPARSQFDYADALRLEQSLADLNDDRPGILKRAGILNE